MGRTLQGFVSRAAPAVSALWLNAVDQFVASSLASIYNIKSDGVTDDTAAFNAAYTAISSAGGGFLFLAPGSTTIIAGQLIKQSNVVVMGYGCTIKLTGTGSIGSPATGATNCTGMFGVTIDSTGSTAAQKFTMMSELASYYKDMKFAYNSLTDVVIYQGTNTTGSLNLVGNLNGGFCTFENITGYGPGASNGCGTFMAISGTDANHVVTDNVYWNVQVNGINVIGFDGRQWGDSHIFGGMTRVGLNGNISPANGIGVAIGSTGQGIYSWNIQHLAIDTFGIPATDNRQGVVSNYGTGAKNIKISILFMGPQNEQNALNNVGSLLSYDITVAPRTTTNYQSKHLVGTNIGIGVQATTNTSQIIGVGAWMTGASQYASFVQGSAYPQGSPSSGASYGCQPGLPASGTPYTVAQVFGYYVAAGTLGTNATATTTYGFYCSDQNYGSSNNYGFVSAMNAGAGKFAFFGAGTAPSQLGGALGLGGAAPAGTSFYNALNPSAATSYINYTPAVAQSTVSGCAGYVTGIGTQATAFTLPNLSHFLAVQGTFGAGSTVTSQYGFVADATLAGAANNFGFASNVPAAANNYAFFSSTTAQSKLGGPLGVNNTTPPAKVTGFGTPTGTGVINNFPGATATLAQCSQAIAQLITDLKNIGFYGA